jgi:hypothetical protein
MKRTAIAVAIILIWLTDSPVSAMDATPYPVDVAASFPGMNGALPSDLPTAPDGEVAAVSEGPYSPWFPESRQVLIHNNSDEISVIRDIVTEIRSINGDLVGASTEAYPVHPVMQPYSYTIAQVYLKEPPTDGQTITIDVRVADELEEFAIVPTLVPITEISATDSSILGYVENASEKDVAVARVVVFCLDADGTPINTMAADGVDRLKPGESFPFQATLLDDLPLAESCPFYIAYADGLNP